MHHGQTRGKPKTNKNENREECINSAKKRGEHP